MKIQRSIWWLAVVLILGVVVLLFRPSAEKRGSAEAEAQSRPPARLPSAPAVAAIPPIAARPPTLPREVLSAKWKTDARPAFAAFRDWTARYLSATPAERAKLLAEGIELARQRREALAKLIRTDPRAALAVAVPMVVRQQLPADIVDLLETRVSGRGQLSLLAITPMPGQTPAEPIFRTAVIDGTDYRAYVYGRRDVPGTVSATSLLGIAVDRALAVSEAPLRVLEAGEVAADRPLDLVCGISGETTAFTAETALNTGGEPTAVEYNGKVQILCHIAHVAVLAQRLQLSEHSNLAADGGPGTSGVANRPTYAWTHGAKKVLIIRAEFSDVFDDAADPSPQHRLPTPAEVDNLMNRAGAVKAFFVQGSYGQASVEVRPAVGGVSPDVTTSVVRLPRTQSYYIDNAFFDDLHADARALALAAGYDEANYDRVGVVMPYSPNAGFAGLGDVGGRNFWINGAGSFGVFLGPTDFPRTVAHELGHTFGLVHSNRWYVDYTTNNPIDAGGTSYEYGDVFDVMGSGNNFVDEFSHWNKSILQWIPDTAVTVPPASGTYRVYRLDGGPATDLTHPRAIKLVGDGIHDYWIGYRGGIANPALNGGAYVIRGFSTANNQGQLLDMTTPGINWLTDVDDDSPLAIGATFTDAANHVTIKPVAQGGSGAEEWLDVQVTMMPRVQWAQTSYSVDERTGTVTVTVKRTIDSVGAVSVNYTTVAGTAAVGSDFTATSGTLNWADGDAGDKTITIPLTVDDTVEASKDFMVVLSGVTGASLDGSDTATVTITDAGPPARVKWSQNSASLDERVGSVTLTVQRTTDSTEAVSVDYATVPGTATAPADFTATSGTLNWAVGDTADKTITIPITIDDTIEGTEDFTVVLSGLTHAVLQGDPTATVTITDVGPPARVQWAQTTRAVEERTGSVVLTASRTADSVGTVTVNYATVAGTATAPADFTAKSGTLTWADGDMADKTVTITLTVDAIAELAENFTVVLSAPTNAQLGAQTTATITVTDDGILDPAFVLSGLNGTPSRVVVLPDGRLLFASNSSVIFGPHNEIYDRPGLARFNADGSFDPTFGADGQCDGAVYDLAVAADGKIVAVGDFTQWGGASRRGIVRLNADGSLDATFNPGTGATGPVNAVLIQPDGKIVIGGGFYNYNNTAPFPYFLARVNADGSMDTSFHGPSFAGPPVSKVSTMALQPDGKLLLGGSFYFADSPAPLQAGICRVLSDGSLDSTFNGVVNGFNYPGDPASPGIVNQIVLQPDGKILVGGRFDGYNLTACGGLVRLTSTGALDLAFATTTNGEVGAILLRPDGKIVVGGAFTNFDGAPAPHLARFSAAGVLDTAYAAVVSYSTSVFDLALRPDGRMLFCGYIGFFQGGTDSSMLWQLPPGLPALPGTVQLASATYSGTEGGNAVLSVTRTGGSAGPLTVGYSTVPGTATSADFTAQAGTLTWADGDAATKTITVPLSTDALTEGAETFTVNIGQPLVGSVMLGAIQQATVTIDDPAAVGFATWQSAKFTAGELLDVNVSGPNAIYGQDGLPNLVKYALGLEPKQNITSGLPTVSVVGTDWVYTYTRPDSTTITDVAYAVEVSTDLVNWSSVGVTHEFVSNSNGIDTWHGRYPLGPATNCFFRLKVTR